MRTTARSAMILTGGLLMGLALAGSYKPEPFSEEDAYGFLYERDAAFRACDVEWIAHHYAAAATFSFETPGASPVVELLEDVLRSFRKACSPGYSQPSFSRRNWSVQVGGSQASVRIRESEGLFVFFDPVLQRLRITPQEVDSVECTLTMARGLNGQIQAQSEHWLVRLRPETSRREGIGPTDRHQPEAP